MPLALARQRSAHDFGVAQPVAEPASDRRERNLQRAPSTMRAKMAPPS